jgi:hypothetical protein
MTPLLVGRYSLLDAKPVHGTTGSVRSESKDGEKRGVATRCSLIVIGFEIRAWRKGGAAVRVILSAVPKGQAKDLAALVFVSIRESIHASSG